MNPVGTLTWLPDGQSQEAFEELSLTVHAMLSDRVHRQACGGQADCGTCRIRVVEGAENLSPPTVDERALVAEFPDCFEAEHRLACQCRPTGHVTVEIPRGIRDLRYAKGTLDPG